MSDAPKDSHPQPDTPASDIVSSGGFGIWSPIDTAPHDGTNILATDGERIALVWWQDEWRDYGDIGAAGQYTFEATHWMMLPPLPNGAHQPQPPTTQK